MILRFRLDLVAWREALQLLCYCLACCLWPVSSSSYHLAPLNVCKTNEAFYFNVQPKGITVRENSRAFLECNTSTFCNIQFHWTLNDVIVANTTRRYQNGSNLVITRVNRSLDTGDFHCIATLITNGLARESQPAALSILWISQNASVELVSPGQEVVDSGNVTDIELLCVADGFDEPTYRWYHNANRLKKTDHVIPRQRRLLVKDVTIADNGVYSCEAENAAGTIRSQSNFILSIPGNVPKIKLLSSDQVVRLGSSVMLDCAFDAASEVRWKRPGHDSYYPRVPTSARIFSLKNNSLIIRDVQSPDAGSYECFGFSHAASSVQSYAVAINLATLEDFRSSSFEPVRDIYIVGQGKRFEVACVPPHGYPTPLVFWSRNGEAMKIEGRVRATTDYSLIIDSARQDDKGPYDCIAQNTAGVKKGTLYIHVSRAPQMERHPSSLEVEEGSDARFDCTFKGNEYPVTFVEWEKNGEPFTLHTRDPRYQVFHNNGTLKIASASLTDVGEYTCVVKTADQRPLYSQPARLNVRERLKFTPKPVHKKLELNSDAQIPCKASGHIPATVKWLRTGNISIDGTIHKFKQPVTDFGQNIRDKDGVLYFHKARFEYAGLYMCVAVSSQGVINETIKVEVFVAPVFDTVPKNMTVEEEEPAWLHCVVRGTPHPTVHWYFDGSPESEWKFRYRKFQNNTLLLPSVNVDLAGKYVCMAGNKGGFKRHEALLCVKLKVSNFSHCGKQFGLRQPVFGNTVESSFEEIDHRPGLAVTTVGIACGAAASYILLIICLVAYCGYRRRNKRALKANSPLLNTGVANDQMPEANGVGSGGGGDLLLTGCPSNGFVPSSASSIPRHASAGSRGRLALFDHFQVPREWLQYQSNLGSGVYGEVFLMKLIGGTGASCTSDDKQVIVKSLMSKNEWVHAEFLYEIEMHSKCDHRNVAKLLGICSTQEPIYMVLEYAQYGNLKHYMQASRHYKPSVSSSYPPPLNEGQIVNIAYQVAQGMEHLSGLRFVHKDLAARNVLISPEMNAKVTHLSLSNDQFFAEYYSYRNLVLPLRWIPDEALFDDEWSMKSDVWSFGVFLWEMYTVGEMPYQTYSNEEVIEMLKRRELRITFPACLPQVLQNFLLKCWSVSPKDRPTFTDICELFASFHVDTGV